MEWGKRFTLATVIGLLFSFSSPSFAQPYCPDANFWRQPIPNDSLLHISEADPHARLDFDNLKVLVWNIYKLGKPGVLADIDTLTQKTDLALFQEGFLTSSFLNLVCSRPDMNWMMAKSFDDKGVSAGVITASRENPREAAYLKSPNTEPFSSIHKMTLVSLYDIPDRHEKLMVLNIHGINFVPHDFFVNQINVVAKAIESHDGPIIFGGDFNTYTDARMSFLLKKMKALGLTQAKVKGNEFQGLLVLDHLFYRGFDLVKSEALKHVKSSDHVPIYFEFKLSE